LRTPGRQDGDEAELIDRARNGDSEAFGVLVERYQRRVVGVALAVVKNQDDAIELAQETFVRAFENLKNFESRSSFSTWLYRIAANLSIDFWRREPGVQRNSSYAEPGARIYQLQVFGFIREEQGQAVPDPKTVLRQRRGNGPHPRVQLPECGTSAT